MVNKNEHARINYGTGKDVSDDRIEDAREPLRVRWPNNRYGATATEYKEVF